MRKKSKGLAVIYAGVLLTIAACASQQQLVTIGPAKGETALEMKADDFKFEPNNIKAFEGDVIVLRIENKSNSGHNFTIKDPEGNALQSAALPPKETVSVKVALSKAGVYEFYCDKPFHPALGMKGKITVEQGP